MEQSVLEQKRIAVIKKVTFVAIIVNVLLSLAKIIIGFVSGSLSVLGDGVESFTDLIISVIILFIVFFMANKPKERQDKIEKIISRVVGIIIILTGLWLGIESVLKLINKDFIVIDNLYWLMLSVTIFSIIEKEFLYQYTMYYSRKIKSAVLRADAVESRKDSLSSFAVLIGLVGAKFGVLWMEIAAAFTVAALIAFMGVMLLIKGKND